MTSLLFRLICLIWASLCLAEFNSSAQQQHSRDPFSCDVVLYMALQSTGIVTLSFDPSRPVADSIQIVETNTHAGFMPGWITQYGNDFYSVSRTEFPTSNSVHGGVFAFRRSGPGIGANLTLLNSVDSGGQGAVYTDVSRDGRIISVANMSVKTHTHPLGYEIFLLTL